MNRLPLLRSIFVTGVTLGAIAVTTASAETTGFTYLEKETGTTTFEGEGGNITIAAGATKIKCTAAKTKGESTQTEGSVTTGSATITLTGCKLEKGESKLACNTEAPEKDAKETVLAAEVWTRFNALDRATKTVLEPGLGVTLTSVRTYNCGAGTAKVEVKGTWLGLITEVSLTADVTAERWHFLNEGELCDTGNVFCKQSQENANTLLCNTTGVFEPCTLEADLKVAFNKMHKVDD
jgi:pectate lyase